MSVSPELAQLLRRMEWRGGDAYERFLLHESQMPLVKEAGKLWVDYERIDVGGRTAVFTNVEFDVESSAGMATPVLKLELRQVR